MNFQIPQRNFGALPQRQQHQGPAVQPLPAIPHHPRQGQALPRGATDGEEAPSDNAAARTHARRARPHTHRQERDAVPGHPHHFAAHQARRPVAVHPARYCGSSQEDMVQ